MKFRILFDNYCIYILIFGIYSIAKYILFDQKFSIGLFVITGFLWLSDLIFEKKKYLVNFIKIEDAFEITYLNVFLQKKKYIRQNVQVRIAYRKNATMFSKFDVLQIVEKDSFKIIKFKIIEKSLSKILKLQFGK
ncbi:MAG: hypothetical protein EOP00_17770 [Pedobacter sp.]|nr:MAG: hypothetical protein EOP00_17770 [Pedobacter sp.]